MPSRLLLFLPRGVFPLFYSVETHSARATCPDNLIFLDLITLIIFGEACKLCNSSLCNFFSPPSFDFLHHRPKYLPQRPILEQPSFMLVGDQDHTHLLQQANCKFKVCKSVHHHTFISFSSLSYDRSKVSSKASCPHSAIQSFLLQMRVSSPFLKVIQ